jgi:hypothetical protein
MADFLMPVLKIPRMSMSRNSAYGKHGSAHRTKHSGTFFSSLAFAHLKACRKDQKGQRKVLCHDSEEPLGKYCVIS